VISKTDYYTATKKLAHPSTKSTSTNRRGTRPIQKHRTNKQPKWQAGGCFDADFVFMNQPLQHSSGWNRKSVRVTHILQKSATRRKSPSSAGHNKNV